MIVAIGTVSPSATDTEHSIGLTRQASELGAAAVLAVTPYYNRPSQAGLRGHFGAIADSTALPVMTSSPGKNRKKSTQRAEHLYS